MKVLKRCKNDPPYLRQPIPLAPKHKPGSPKCVFEGMRALCQLSVGAGVLLEWCFQGEALQEVRCLVRISSRL